MDSAKVKQQDAELDRQEEISEALAFYRRYKNTPSNTSIPVDELREAVIALQAKHLVISPIILSTPEAESETNEWLALIEAHTALKVKEAHTLGQLDGLELAMRAVAAALEQRNTDAIQQVIDTLKSSLDQTDSDTTRRAS